MVFSSLIFLYLFFPLFMVIYYLCPKRFKNLFLLVGSLIFYSFGEPTYVCIMFFSMIIGHMGTRLMEADGNNNDKRTCIFVTVLVIEIGLLVFFKYFVFLIDNFNAIFGTQLKIREISLPLGISFYTFQIVSYIIDVYKNKTKAQKSFINFAAYVAMFPQIVAGPIVRYADIERQLDSREFSAKQIGEGVERFIIGLGKKVLIANNVGQIWTLVKATSISQISAATAWIGIIAFTLQIYFDFSGYSDMAIGLGKMMGFDFMENFNYPYISKSITEFWRRWHISLGNWFRDYVYIPLGGNRKGKIRQIINIFIVWFITGLWHGASWNFILWGIYFGILLLIEKLFLLRAADKMPVIICNLYTIVLVIIGWVFFDTDSVTRAFLYIRAMFGMNHLMLYDHFSAYLLRTNSAILIIACLCSTPLIKIMIGQLKKNSLGRGCIIAGYMLVVFIATAYLVGESYNPFLYFRF